MLYPSELAKFQESGNVQMHDIQVIILFITAGQTKTATAINSNWYKVIGITHSSVHQWA